MRPKATTFQTTLSGKKKSEGWPRRRRSSTQPWMRGRIRPSSCHDLKGKE